MEDTNFGAAIWSYDWQGLQQDESCPQGTANLSDDSVVLNLPFDQLLAGGATSDFEATYPDNADFLYGFTQDGYYLSLTDATQYRTSTHIPGGIEQTIHGRYLLASHKTFDPTSNIEHAAIRFHHLRNWVAKSPFITEMTTNPLRFSAIKYDKDNKDKYDLLLLDDNQVTARLRHIIGIPSNGVGDITISHDVVIDLEFKQTTKLRDLVGKALSLGRFLSFCLGFYAELKELQCITESSDSIIRVYGTFPKAKPQGSSRLASIPFKLTDIEDTIGTHMSKWLNAPNLLKESSSIIVSLMANNWDMPFNLNIIAASQALEALSKLDTDTKSLDDAQYERYRTVVLSGVSDHKIREWAGNKLNSNRKGQKKLLQEMIERYSAYLAWLVGDGKAFVKEHVNSRNSFIHIGNTEQDKEGWEREYWHYRATIFVCYLVICANLGIPAEKVLNRLHTSSFENYAISKVRKIYAS